MKNLLNESLKDGEQFQHWKNEVRSKFSNELGPHMIELLRTKENQLSDQGSYEPARDRIVLTLVMAEAMGDMLAQAVIKSLPNKLQEAASLQTMFIGMVDQLKICGIDFLERNFPSGR